MGAGKTTVGLLLAARLGWDFIDSDRVVEGEAGMRVAEIFERSGESAFRKMEAAAIRESAARDQVVVALGGGALEAAETRELLVSVPGCLVVFLEAPLEVLLARCGGDAEGPVRPVLADRGRLGERWTARLPWYRQAHLTVATEGIRPDAVAERIAQFLGAEDASGGDGLKKAEGDAPVAGRIPSQRGVPA